MAEVTSPGGVKAGWNALNTKYHKLGLGLFMLVVIAHWAEHIAQAIQIYVLGWPIPESRGVLGQPFPWLVKSEWMHYGYALIMLIGLIILRPGFTGRARTWWTISLGIQVWHHFEHLLLLIQKLSGHNIADKPVPTSILQLFYTRVPLHLFYNGIVFIPMIIAVYLHQRPRAPELELMKCTCADSSRDRILSGSSAS